MNSGTSNKRRLDPSSDRSGPHKKGKHTPLQSDFPIDLSFIETKSEGNLRIASWNVASVQPRGGPAKPQIRRYVEAEQPDLLALQEIKTCSDSYMEDIYPWRYFARVADNKAKHGVALFSKFKPISVYDNFPARQPATMGRFLALEFESTVVMTVYAPMSGAHLAALKEKLHFNSCLRDFVHEFHAKGKKVICVGDFNTIQADDDMHRAAAMHSGEAGRSPQERQSLKALMDSEKLTDIWRRTHPDVRFIYTYYHPTYRSRGIGQRIDFVLISNSLLPSVETNHLRRKVYGKEVSDHCPVMLEMKQEFKL